MTTNVTVTGVDELDQAMAELPAKLQKQGLRKALRDAGKMVADEAEECHSRSSLFEFKVKSKFHWKIKTK